MTGNNIIGNRYFYLIDPVTAPPKLKFQCKGKGDDLDGHVFQRCFVSQK